MPPRPAGEITALPDPRLHTALAAGGVGVALGACALLIELTRCATLLLYAVPACLP
jgi:hypothetical protein